MSDDSSDNDVPTQAGHGTDGVAEQERAITLRKALTSMWQVFWPFFCDRKTALKAWGLLVTSVSLMGAASWLMIRMTFITNDLENALKSDAPEEFWPEVYKFAIYVLAGFCLFFLWNLLFGTFVIEWRRYITTLLVNAYVNDDQCFYKLKMQFPELDNPDQRIADDAAKFANAAWNIFSSIVISIFLAVGSASTLYSISGKMLAVALVGGLLTALISMLGFLLPLVKVERTLAAREAFFRFSLVRIRENAEAIAFYRGGKFEQEASLGLFAQVVTALYRKLIWSVGMTAFFSTGGEVMTIVPLAIMGHEYFAGSVVFGQVGQARSLCGSVFKSLSSLASNADSIAQLGAQAARVQQLVATLKAMSAMEAPDYICAAVATCCDAPLVQDAEEDRIGLEELPAGPPHGDFPCLQLQDVCVKPPGHSEDFLVRGVSLRINYGDSLIIRGPSGVGKSTLLRAVSGLWLSGEGSIKRPAITRCFFAPQAPYLCLGTLRNNVMYPLAGDGKEGGVDCSDRRVISCLEKVGIGYLAERHGLDEVFNFDAILSGGEKQRFGFVRLLMRDNIDLAVMDESTSALDAATEDKVYALLKAHVKSFVSVGHRTRLDEFHTHRLELDVAAGGHARAVLKKL